MLCDETYLHIVHVSQSLDAKKEVICQCNWYCYEHANDNPANVKEGSK